MTNAEKDLIRLIRESNAPELVMAMMMDTMSSYLSGESIESIDARKLLFDLDMLSYEFECATANLDTVHSMMEADGGANWKRMCDALFSSYLQLCNIQERLAKLTTQAEKKILDQRAETA